MKVHGGSVICSVGDPQVAFVVWQGTAMSIYVSDHRGPLWAIRFKPDGMLFIDEVGKEKVTITCNENEVAVGDKEDV